MSDYSEFQESLDKVIAKIGLRRAKILLDSFIDNTSISQDETHKIQMVTQYLVSNAIRLYGLAEENFLTSTVLEYRDARMTCFHLLRKYTSDSLPKIGLGFRCSSRVVGYGCEVTEDRLSLPKANARFVANYTQLESKLIDFIGKIN